MLLQCAGSGNPTVMSLGGWREGGVRGVHSIFTTSDHMKCFEWDRRGIFPTPGSSSTAAAVTDTVVKRVEPEEQSRQVGSALGRQTVVDKEKDMI